jgi:hypothetical protein
MNFARAIRWIALLIIKGKNVRNGFSFLLIVAASFLGAASCYSAVTGSIVNDLGTPAIGANITLIDEADSTLRYSATTDGAGRYTIDLNATGVAESADEPAAFSLGRNYPNPFNPSTVIPFTLARPGLVSLTIYSALGQKVRTLVNGSLSAGEHHAVWNGRDDRGRGAAAGVYLYRLRVEGRAESNKMLLLDGAAQQFSSGPAQSAAKASSEEARAPAGKITGDRTFRVEVSGSMYVTFQQEGTHLADGAVMDLTIVRTAAPSAMYSSRILQCLDWAESFIPSMSQVADVTAARLAAGGKIYITGDQELTGVTGGFMDEAIGRAGGMYRMQALPSVSNVGLLDVVLAGTMELAPDEQAALLASVRAKKALVILFGSGESRSAAQADYVVDHGLGTGIVPVMEIGNGSVIGPLAGVANVIDMWTFTSELVASLTRLGKMPNMYQSGFVPGGSARNSSFGTSMFSSLTISPIQPGVLGGQYISALRGYMEKIRLHELPEFCRGGAICREQLATGHRLVLSNIGHFMNSQSHMQGFPDVIATLLENKNGVANLQGTIGKDDVWVYIGYSYYPLEELNYARLMGTKTISVFAPGPSVLGEGNPVEIDRSLTNIYIDPYWRFGDAVVEVPGYDIRIIPPSGVMMVSCYWMILGEIASNEGGMW